MSTHIGYVRVSSEGQNESRQLDDTDVEFKKIFTDKQSGKTTNRPELQRALEFLREGDFFHVHSIDRLARNLQDLQTVVNTLVDRGVTVVFHKERLEFTAAASSTSKLMLQMMGAFAEFERSLIRERQREGIELAKKRGVYKGRKPKLSSYELRRIKERAAAGESVTSLAKEYNISRQTLYRSIPRQEMPQHVS